MFSFNDIYISTFQFLGPKCFCNNNIFANIYSKYNNQINLILLYTINFIFIINLFRSKG